MILGAIQANQNQPWMYETLVLAMQIGNHGEAEIARALTSAVDLSQDRTDIMVAAKVSVRHWTGKTSNPSDQADHRFRNQQSGIFRAGVTCCPENQ